MASRFGRWGGTGDDLYRMKRSELERRLRTNGCYLKREGRSHSTWITPQIGGIDQSG